MSEKKEEKKVETLSDLRQLAADMKQQIKSIEDEIKERQDRRSKLQREFRSLIGKIETRVAAGEV